MQKKWLFLTGSEVLKDGRAVYSSRGSNPPRGGGTGLQVTVDSDIYRVEIGNGNVHCAGCGRSTFGEILYLPTGNWSPALALLLTAFCFAFPESLPALPPAISGNRMGLTHSFPTLKFMTQSKVDLNLEDDQFSCFQLVGHIWVVCQLSRPRVSPRYHSWCWLSHYLPMYEICDYT